MALRKCPKCELNYIRDDQSCCDICARAAKRVLAKEKKTGAPKLCTECGEEPAVRNGLCAECYKEHKRQIDLENAANLPDDGDEDELEVELDLIEDDDDDDEDEE